MNQPKSKKQGQKKKKREQEKKKPEQKKNLFERNPRKTLIFTVVFFMLILDALAGVIFIPADEHSFRCSNPYYHHDFLSNQNVETSWGYRKYRLFTNSLGFRDGTVRDVPLKAEANPPHRRLVHGGHGSAL
jgi:hypothetical protein